MKDDILIDKKINAIYIIMDKKMDKKINFLLKDF